MLTVDKRAWLGAKKGRVSPTSGEKSFGSLYGPFSRAVVVGGGAGWSLFSTHSFTLSLVKENPFTRGSSRISAAT